MAIQCTLEKSRTEEKYFARTRKTGKIGMNEIAEEIQRNCSATCGDVTLVLTELMDVIRDHLLNGEEVTIDGLGSFHVGVTSDSVVNPADFKHSNIHGVHLKFREDAKRDTMTWKLTRSLTDDAIIEIR